VTCGARRLGGSTYGDLAARPPRLKRSNPPHDRIVLARLTAYMLHVQREGPFVPLLYAIIAPPSPGPCDPASSPRTLIVVSSLPAARHEVSERFPS